jgi:hypothetical protein
VGGACVRLAASEPDFVAAEIQPAELLMKYASNDIAGLDEAGLLPYRWNSATSAYTDEGISDVSLDASGNSVTFRTRYPGIFVLSAPAGTGDTSSGEGPTGVITINCMPSEPQMAGTGAELHLESQSVAHSAGGNVAAGTLFTVEAPLLLLNAPDASESLPGYQVAANSAGAVAFDAAVGMKAGLAWVRLRSVTGSASGSLAVTIMPGTPARGMSLWMANVEEGEPAIMELAPMFSRVLDIFGNVVSDGTMLTVSLDGAAFTLPDADDNQPGYQVRVENGDFRIYVESATRSIPVEVSVYADSSQSQILAHGEFRAMNYQPLPLLAAAPIMGLLLMLFGIRACLATGRGSGAGEQG